MIENNNETDEKNDFFSMLSKLPCMPEDPAGQMLVICRPKVEGCGEDCFLALQKDERFFCGVFDGCGGSGGKVYPAFGGHTGAWAASRAAAASAGEWFLSGFQNKNKEAPELASYVRKYLKTCKEQDTGGQVLLGSLSKDFPTTIAAFCMNDTKGNIVDFYWCGDSRCYVLDKDGLHQVTADDSAVQDAMQNLREDAAMTNVASASQDFILHRGTKKIRKPAVILAATDGCFGYLLSPMEWERTLLETMHCASSEEKWMDLLDERIGKVSGDDYTLTAWPHGFRSFTEMKQTFEARLSFLEKNYPAAESEEELFRQWEKYRNGYESMLAECKEDPERGWE